MVAIQDKLERSFAHDVTRFLRARFEEMATKLRPYLRRVRRDRLSVVAGYSRGVDRRRAADAYLFDLLAPLADTLISDEAQTVFELLIFRHLRAAYEAGAVDALHRMGFEASVVDNRRRTVAKAAADPIIFELSDPEIIAALEERARIVGAGLTPAMLGDARRLVRDKMVFGDLGAHQTATQIAAGAGIPHWRGLKIARTEAGQAFNGATFEQYYRSGVRMKAWHTVGDNRVRDDHTMNAAEGYIPIGNAFGNGEMYPGSGSINCRCALLADMRDPKLVLTPWSGNAGAYLGPTLPIAPLPAPTASGISPQMLARLRAVSSPVSKPKFLGPLGKKVGTIQSQIDLIRDKLKEHADDVAYTSHLKRRLTKLEKRLVDVQQGTLPGKVKAIELIEIKGKSPVSPEFKARVVKHLDSLPQKDLARIKKAGIKVRLGHHMDEALPRVKGMTPRGYPAGTKFNEIEGLFSPTENRIVLTEYKQDWASTRLTKAYLSPGRLSTTVRHEVGHAIDKALTIRPEGGGRIIASQQAKYSAQYRQEFVKIIKETGSELTETGYTLHGSARIISYELQPNPSALKWGGSGATDAGASEMFAELYAHLRGGAANRSGGPIYAGRFSKTLAVVKDMIGG